MPTWCPAQGVWEPEEVMPLGTNWVGPRTGVTPAPGLMTKLNDLREAACLKDTVLCVSVCA